MQALGLVWGEVDARAAGFHEVFTVMREPSHYDARHLFEFWRERNDEGGFVIGHFQGQCERPVIGAGDRRRRRRCAAERTRAGRRDRPQIRHGTAIRIRS